MASGELSEKDFAQFLADTLKLGGVASEEGAIARAS
jgi:hypothetical protein